MQSKGPRASRETNTRVLISSSMFSRQFARASCAVLFCWCYCAAQSLTVEEYDPKSTLKVAEHPVPRAKFPVIDVHSHHRGNTSPERLDQIVKEMDEQNLRILVNLSGRNGEQLAQIVKRFKGRHPKRFIIFANLDFNGIDAPDWGAKAAAQLEKDVQNGAQGLKFFKNFGMEVKYSDGRRVPVDDPKLEPVWETCARLKIPVLIHVGEPAPFFEPVDKNNERWLELMQFPGRRRPPDRYPTFEQLCKERDHMVELHPKVNYIIAHLGWHGNDLARLAGLFEKYPNFYTEVGAVLAELGRQPLTAHDWFVKYSSRVLMGKDTYAADEYPYYWRVFETRDEYFDYYRRRHAFWKMYGLGLPDDVLKNVYYKNALRLIPGIDASDFPR